MKLLLFRANHWLFSEALPKWATAGWDGRHGFREHLEADGTGGSTGYKRVGVQARQIYAFSHAHYLGWGPVRPLLESAADFLETYAWLPQGGWATVLDDRGGVLDATPDLQVQATCLFAFAWWMRAGGGDRPRGLAARTWAVIEERLSGSDGAYLSGALQDDEASSSPHMRLLEAVLAMHGATGDPIWLERARPLVELFDRVFVDPESGLVAEVFEADRRTARPKAEVVKPGRQFEWYRLLCAWAQASGRAPPASAERMFEAAERLGVDPRTGLTYDEIDTRGTLVRTSGRLWSQAERLKALLARLEQGRPDLVAVSRTANLITGNYLDQRGWWTDRLTAELAPEPGPAPASAFMHLVSSFAELQRLQPLLVGEMAEDRAASADG